MPRGRPAIDDPRTISVILRMTEAERETLRARADDAGVSMSEYIRRKVLGRERVR